eukprot:jgi/Galph1/2992/GphlegSOOS_G1653.1
MTTKRRVVTSAPGKVILFGEHAVVYGKLAVAAAVDKRLFVSLEDKEDSGIDVKLEGFESQDYSFTFESQKMLQAAQKLFENLRTTGWKLTKDGYLAKPPNFLLSSLTSFAMKQTASDTWLIDLQVFLDSYPLYLSASTAVRSAVFLFLLFYLVIVVYPNEVGEDKGLSITFRSQIPIRAGLGSSAAFSVAMMTCLCVASNALDMSYLNNYQSTSYKEQINEWAFLLETFLHGTPSGMDNTVATFGGFVCFRNRQKESVQTISQPLRLVVVDSGVPRSTQKMVAIVRQKYTEFPQIVEPILNAIDAISNHFLCAIANDTSKESLSLEIFMDNLVILMKTNHCLLNALGVGHSVLEDIISYAAGRGFPGAKLTGAGGGGCVIILIDPKKSNDEIDELLNGLQSSPRYYRCFEIVLGGPGAQIHHVQ